MFVLFALLAAAGWGSSDFAAGNASRKNSAVSVVILTHFASCVALLVISLVPGQGGSPGVPDLGWGLAAGAAGGAGAMLLFRGLGRGSMSVVAPVTATGAALVPVAVGIAQGDAVGRLDLVGVLLAVGAIVLVSLVGAEADESATEQSVAERSVGVLVPMAGVVAVAPGAALPPPDRGGLVSTLAPSAPGARVVVAPPLAPWAPAAASGGEVPGASGSPRRPSSRIVALLRQPGMSDALLSGVGFGLFFVLIAQTSESAGHWPLVTARLLSAVLFTVIAVMTTTAVLPDRGSQPSVVLAGLLDAIATVCFVVSTRSGLLSVGAVLASLYPAATVLLARFISAERITRTQVAGLVLAGLAVSLLAI